MTVSICDSGAVRVSVQNRGCSPNGNLTVPIFNSDCELKINQTTDHAELLFIVIYNLNWSTSPLRLSEETEPD